MDDYHIIEKCGEGTYGSVYKAIDKRTNQIVALKKVSNVAKEDGKPVEIKYLEILKDSNSVVNLLNYFYLSQNELFIVMEFLEGDLWKIMSNPSCALSQILKAVYQCHSKGIMHRDIKPANLLINKDGELKLTDFGLSTSFQMFSDEKFSNNVVSLYYRPPELLLGSDKYGPEIDIWSVGCVLMEMLTNKYLFAGKNESEQLDLIFKKFGTPNERNWPGVSAYPMWNYSCESYPIKSLAECFPHLSSSLPTLFDLATKMLALDPKKRITSYQALNHPFFTSSDVNDQLIPSSASFIQDLYYHHYQQQQQQQQHYHQHCIPSNNNNYIQSQSLPIEIPQLPSIKNNLASYKFNSNNNNNNNNNTINSFAYPSTSEPNNKVSDYLLSHHLSHHSFNDQPSSYYRLQNTPPQEGYYYYQPAAAAEVTSAAPNHYQQQQQQEYIQQQQQQQKYQQFDSFNVYSNYNNNNSKSNYITAQDKLYKQTQQQQQQPQQITQHQLYTDYSFSAYNNHNHYQQQTQQSQQQQQYVDYSNQGYQRQLQQQQQQQQQQHTYHQQQTLQQIQQQNLTTQYFHLPIPMNQQHQNFQNHIFEHYTVEDDCQENSDDYCLDDNGWGEADPNNYNGYSSQQASNIPYTYYPSGSNHAQVQYMTIENFFGRPVKCHPSYSIGSPGNSSNPIINPKPNVN
ncbi:putative protein serine/threonine kinase [Heterostelium album PN500]|uniref:Protein kinase domain-containing protein n=1 Tax=Heterostelium pallidum (strain ATCC 26659 / Pp 5 / PN500) TaxID=670386 RepID=D3BUD6_HETP5|nr:putative protein serine/threonine kinase [Heterostelium album PN500]EFA74724.1 putative protein serine/threonine kinase [Heterostelium album PN500]|eukprot:XP_020426858.1 putative protein serine/threonine kinase [Heterostelium album PN500]